MPLPDRNIGFKVERDAPEGDVSKPTRARLVVIDKAANERFVRNIFDAFADRDKKLNPQGGTVSDRRGRSG